MVFELTAANFTEIWSTLMKTNKPFAILFTGPGCTPCEVFKPKYYAFASQFSADTGASTMMFFYLNAWALKDHPLFKALFIDNASNLKKDTEYLGSVPFLYVSGFDPVSRNRIQGSLPTNSVKYLQMFANTYK